MLFLIEITAFSNFEDSLIFFQFVYFRRSAALAAIYSLQMCEIKQVDVKKVENIVFNSYGIISGGKTELQIESKETFLKCHMTKGVLRS